MDPDLNKEVLDVRKVIEKSTSKVSLRDLEKKGFRQVKVLRAGDINQLIFKAVQNVLAKQPRGAGMSDAEREQIAKEARAELDQQMQAMRELQQESQRVEAEKAQVEQKAAELQAAYKNLELKLAEVNKQIQARELALQQQQQAFARDKQALYEKGLEGQQATARQFEGQVQDLRDRLRAAEARAAAADGAVGREEHEALRERLSRAEGRAGAAEQRLAALEGAVPRAEHEDAVARHKQRTAELQQELQETETRAQRYKRHADQLEESEAKLQRRASALTDDVVRLEAEVARLKEAGDKATASGFGSVDGAEIQRMRFEMEQRDAKMKEMITGLAGTLASARGGSGDGADLSKQLKSLQSSLADQLRKSIGTLGKGGGGGDFDLSPEAAAAIFASGKDDVPLETNINTVAVKEQSAAGVKDKLSKLKNLRGGNKP